MKFLVLLSLLCLVHGREVTRQRRSSGGDPLCYQSGRLGTSGPFPKPDDCDNYYQCSNGNLYTMPCPPGLSFNPANSVCDWPSNVDGCPIQSETAIICEHETQKVKCPKGQKIRLESGFYGRDDDTTCPGPIKTTTCAADDSESFLSSKCNGKRKCKIEASNDVFGDPCVGTFKYVKMVYHCADKNSFEVEEPDEDENEDSSSKSE